jgi:hypothetical protein
MLVFRSRSPNTRTTRGSAAKSMSLAPVASPASPRTVACREIIAVLTFPNTGLLPPVSGPIMTGTERDWLARPPGETIGPRSPQASSEDNPSTITWLKARMSTGRPVEPRNLVRSFTRICEDNHLRQIRLHALRHTTSSLLKDLKVPPVTRRSSLAMLTSQRRSRSTPTSTRRPGSTRSPSSTSCSAAPIDRTVVVRIGGQRVVSRSGAERLAWWS